MTATALTSHFTAADGRPFEVRWQNPAAAHELWHWNDSHQPAPLSPLHEWVCLHPPGRLRAYEEAGVDAPALFRGFEVHHGFQFTRDPALQGEDRRQFVEKSRAFAAKMGGVCEVWEHYSLPRVKDTCRALQSAPVETPVAALAELFNYGFHLTHVAGLTVFLPLHGQLIELLSPHFPPDQVQLLIQEVGQGGDNATVESDRAINRMAALAASDKQAAAAVASGDAATVPGEGPFRNEFDAYFREYGFRTERWGIDRPTLNERPELVLEMVRQAMRAGPSPSERREAALAVRAGAIARIKEALAGRPESLALVDSIAAELEGYVTVREGRALWQHIVAGSLRTALLRKGAALVEMGTVGDAVDILYLLPEEIDGAFAGRRDDLRPRVAERRAVQASWATTTPPRDISADPAKVRTTEAGDGFTLRGLPGSRGSASGLARVILDLDQADEMEPGEVLVCVMTSPPWTPLIGMAAALVTNSGQAFSHSAIAAREYGIPCVVGTSVATVAIRTGDRLEVDGDTGTVTIVQRGGGS